MPKDTTSFGTAENRTGNLLINSPISYTLSYLTPQTGPRPTLGTWWMSKSWGSLMLSISVGSRMAPLPLWQASRNLARPPRHRTHQTGQSNVGALAWTWSWSTSPCPTGSHGMQQPQPKPQPWPQPLLLLPPLHHTGNTARTQTQR